MNKTIIPPAKTYALRVARQYKGNDMNSRPYLFNEVQKLVEDDRLPANFYTAHIDLPRANGNTVNKLNELGINFQYLI